MTAHLIFWPVALCLGLVASLYSALTFERKRAVSRGEAQMEDYRTLQVQPLRARLMAHCIANQFELPVLFYPLVLFLYATGDVSPAMLTLAWVFALGRIAHAAVHVSHKSVELRGMVFSINFLALGLMWALFLWPRLIRF